MAISKDIVQNYIDSALKSEVLEDSFMSFTLPRDEDQSKPSNRTNCRGTRQILLTMSTSSEPENIIKHYVNLMTQVKSPTKFDFLFDVLKLLVQQHPNRGKAICEALCERLDYYNENSWKRSFDLINEILLLRNTSVDYKGVRDILKYFLEIIYLLPQRFEVAIIPQLDILYNTFSTILDHEARLLPAYLGLDELQKRIAQGGAPVWKFSELFYHFIESFRPTAQIFSVINRPDLFPVVGFSTCQLNASWRLDPISAKFDLKGMLPYRDRLKEPQKRLVRYLLEQSFSRDMICSALSLGSKPSQQIRCSELIEQLAVSLIHIMEKSETNLEAYRSLCANNSEHLFQWMHLSNNLLFCVVHNQATISFNQLVESLSEKIRARNLRKGSDLLMWAILQYINSLPKATFSEYQALYKLFDLLYSSRRPLPLLDEQSPYFPQSVAAASIWFQIVKRAEQDQVRLQMPVPPSLRLHYEYINNLKPPEEPSVSVGPREVVYLNAHGSNKGSYPVNNFVDYLSSIDPALNHDPITARALPVKLLDTLTIHSKVNLLHGLVQRIGLIAQMSQNNSSTSPYILTPALIETYGRLLIYSDYDTYAVKALIGVLIQGPQAVWRLNAWGIYHVLLEMFSYRVHHFPMHYKFQMLVSFHNLSSMVYGANHLQLSITMEAAELKLLLGLSSHEALNMPIDRRHNDTKAAKHLINTDSEELNKVLVLVIARSTLLTSSEQVNHATISNILTDINKVTPLTWSSSTLSFFPSVIKDFYPRREARADKTGGDQQANQLDQQLSQLPAAVEEEYRKWQAMSNEETLFAHFSQPSGQPLFLCVLWRMIMENEYLNPVVFRILDSLRIRTLTAHLRTFVDFLVLEFARGNSSNILKAGEALNRLILKDQIISLDRFLLCICLRSFDGSQAETYIKVCFYIIQTLLLKSEFRLAVQEYCSIQHHEHWTEEHNCTETNLKFRASYPEKFYHDHLNDNNIPSKGQTLPSFFGNICLRFLPVFDVIIHRALELQMTVPNIGAAINVDQVLEVYAPLYRFHNKPLTYLYNTLYYYNSRMPHTMRMKLTISIVGAFDQIRPANWCLSEQLTQYLRENPTSILLDKPQKEWVPGLDYYRKIIGRLVDALQNKNSFYHTDWRFNEFPNVKAHAVYATAIEFMSLPISQTVVGNAILDLVLTSYVTQDRSTMSRWMNAIGLIMTALPSSYYSVLETKILEYMKSPLLTNPAYTKDILHLINYCDSHEWMYESQISYLVALTHAIWHHSSTGAIFNLPKFWREQVKPAVDTESQFLFVCSLIGPFLSRLERSRAMMEVGVDLYEMLGKVDSNCEIQHLNTISSFFYHIKYQFTGDAIKNEIERYTQNFKDPLRYCLRFLTHLNVSNELHERHE